VSFRIGDPRLDEAAQPGGDGAPNRRRTTAPVPRFGHGSRVPGWDESVDLSKDPALIPDKETTPVPSELRQEIEAAMAKYPDRRSAAIPALHAAQALHGWCSPAAIHQVAAVMQVTPAYLSSVATFYDMLENRPEKVGHHDVYVCTNISCSLRGADDILDAMVKAAALTEGEVHVRSFECLGACDIAPMASVDGEYVGPLTEQDTEQIVEDLRAGRPVLEAKQLRFRKCADPGVEEGASEFSPRDDARKTDTAGLSDATKDLDRPGPTAAVEMPAEEASEEAGDDT
jgi:NADH:ubiquinone oxidoreductase subunit E